MNSTTDNLARHGFRGLSSRGAKVAIRKHTPLDLRGLIPAFAHIADDKMRDVNQLDQTVPDAGAFCRMSEGSIGSEQSQTFPGLRPSDLLIPGRRKLIIKFSQ